MANFNYLSKDKVENDSIKNKSTYLLEGVKFVVQIVKKPVNNKICSERGFLCLNKHGGVMSAGEYFYQGSPSKPINSCEQLLIFNSSDEADKYIKDNLIQIVLDIGELSGINICSREVVSYIEIEEKFKVVPEFLSPEAFKIDVTSNIKTKSLPIKTLYKD